MPGIFVAALANPPNKPVDFSTRFLISKFSLRSIISLSLLATTSLEFL
jgi:hypothetical protein